MGWPGGGVEYKITPAWSAKAEYQHFDLGRDSNTVGDRLAMPCWHQTQFATVRVGVNYFVGGVYEPLK